MLTSEFANLPPVAAMLEASGAWLNDPVRDQHVVYAELQEEDHPYGPIISLDKISVTIRVPWHHVLAVISGSTKRNLPGFVNKTAVQ